jgi:hypothetical protein
MNTIPKTDECIKMLNDAAFALMPERYTGRCAKWFDKDANMDYLKKIRAMLDYRLIPHDIFEPISDKANKENLIAYLKKCNDRKALSDIDNLWYVMNNYKLVTADDLKNEFWEICPNIESIQSFINVVRVKFEEVIFPYDVEITAIGVGAIDNEYQGMNELVGLGKITAQEAADMLIELSFIASRCYFKIERIKDIYRTFEKMTEPPLKGAGEYQQITLPDNVLKWLQETICSKGKPFIEKATVNTHVWNWLQNKELARQLLTHPKVNINGLKGKELEKKISELFYYPKDKKPLTLAKPKKRKEDSMIPLDLRILTKFLATL